MKEYESQRGTSKIESGDFRDGEGASESKRVLLELPEGSTGEGGWRTGLLRGEIERDEISVVKSGELLAHRAVRGSFDKNDLVGEEKERSLKHSRK